MNTPIRDLWERAVLAAIQGMFSNTDALKKGTDWIVEHAINAANTLSFKADQLASLTNLRIAEPTHTEPINICSNSRAL